MASAIGCQRCAPPSLRGPVHRPVQWPSSQCRCHGVAQEVRVRFRAANRSSETARPDPCAFRMLLILGADGSMPIASSSGHHGIQLPCSKNLTTAEGRSVGPECAGTLRQRCTIPAVHHHHRTASSQSRTHWPRRSPALGATTEFAGWKCKYDGIWVPHRVWRELDRYDRHARRMIISRR